MNDKPFFDSSNSSINHRHSQGLWGTNKPAQFAGDTPGVAVEPPVADGKYLRWLKKLAWTSLSVMLLAALLTWGINSRFGSLLLLLLR